MSSSAEKGSPLFSRTFRAALMTPLILACATAAAQMIPVDQLPAQEHSGPAYARSADAGFMAVSSGSSSSSTADPRSPTAAGTGAGVQLPPPLNPRHETHFGPFSTVALGITGGTLGPGLELAFPLARSLNLRVGGSYFNFQTPFAIDGLNYDMALKLTSGQGAIDWFPTHGAFHISAGALYFKNSVGATADVPPGQQFKLGGVTYLNSVDDPVHGTASLKFQRKIAPMVLFGVGNLIPRSGRHISIPFEFGGAYLAPPVVAMQLAGTSCTAQGCFNTATDPTVQANRAAEEAKLNRDIRLLQVYPILSIGLAMRF